MSSSDLLPVAPVLIISVWAILLLLLDLFITNKGLTASLAAAQKATRTDLTDFLYHFQ